MENITIGQIVASIATLTAIFVFIQLISKFIKKHYTDVINDIKKRLEIVEIKTNEQNKDIQDSKEERRLLMRGVLACLNGLHEQGCNNTVTTTIQEYENYLQRQAHK